MSKIVFSIFFSTFLLFLTASDVFACSCFIVPDVPIERQVKDAYTKSTSVFVGEVTAVTSQPNIYFISVKFKIEQSWSKNFQKEITVSTGKGSGDCGYSFEVGKKYLIYAYGESNKLSTNICTRTALAEANKDLAVLNKIKKPKLKSSPK